MDFVHPQYDHCFNSVAGEPPILAYLGIAMLTGVTIVLMLVTESQGAVLFLPAPGQPHVASTAAGRLSARAGS